MRKERRKTRRREKARTRVEEMLEWRSCVYM